MTTRRLTLVICAICYAVAFCFIYVNYFKIIYPATFDSTLGDSYGGAIRRTDLEFSVSFLLAVVPVAFYSFSRSASSMLNSLIYVVYYVPSIFTVHYALDTGFTEALALEGSLAVTMCGLFYVGRYWKFAGQLKPLPVFFSRLVFGVTVVMLLTVVATYGGHMRIVSFADVYDLRTESNEITRQSLIGYCLTWLTYCLLPFALARGFVYKERVNLLLGLAGCVVIYASTGAKAAILTPFALGAFYFIVRSRLDILKSILLGVTVATLLIAVTVPDSDALLIKAVFFTRLLGAPGWATTVYYEFFSNHPLTYLSHVGIINALTGMYPYGSLQLGQVFGLELMDQSLNAGFWASEGIASFGLFGVYFASLMVAAYFLALNWLTRSIDRMVIEIWMCGFAMALLNTPFFSLMLTGGGALIIIILLFFRMKPPVFRRRLPAS